MVNNVQEHHNEEEVQVIRLQNEINYWKIELEFISKEIDFYIDLLNSSLIKKTNANHIDANYLSHQFRDLKETNDIHRRKCEIFQPKLNEKTECDEIQCDHAFLNAHLCLRSKIEKHFIEVRNIKYSAFTYLKNGIEEFLN